MKSVVINSRCGIGDAVAYSFPLCRLLKEKENKTVEFWQINKENLMSLARCLPYIDNIEFFYFDYEIDYSDPVKMVKEFIFLNKKTIERAKKTLEDADEVYLLSSASKELQIAMTDMWGVTDRVIDHQFPLFLPDANTGYAPMYNFALVGKEYDQRYMDFDLEWFKEYHHDFQCKKNSILLNCDAAESWKRGYAQEDELRAILTDRGFDVRRFDYTIPLPTNLFLVAQVSYILTVTTSTVYLAKALNRNEETYVITPTDAYRDYKRFLRINEICNGIRIDPEKLADLFCEEIKWCQYGFL